MLVYKRLKRKVGDLLNRLKFYLSGSNSWLYINYYRYLYKPQKGTLSEFLDQYSRSKKGDFTVVQIGANDGMINDPIHKYIKRDRWRGILLEPQRYLCETFLIPLHARNAQIIPVCAALGSYDGESTLYTIGFTKMRWATGLASFDYNTLSAAYDNGTIHAKCQKYGIPLPDKEAEWITPQTVDLISTHTLLRKYSIDKIDLLQIDTEGYDYEVIKLFDIAKTRPQAIIYEHHHLSTKDRQECSNLLQRHGYTSRIFGADTLAISS